MKNIWKFDSDFVKLSNFKINKNRVINLIKKYKMLKLLLLIALSF